MPLHYYIIDYLTYKHIIYKLSWYFIPLDNIIDAYLHASIINNKIFIL